SRTSTRPGTSRRSRSGWRASCSSRWRRRHDVRRPRLLVMNQYYAPGFEATAYLLSQLCAELAKDFDVTVITGKLAVPRAGAGRTTLDGVKVIRVRSAAFDRSNLP